MGWRRALNSAAAASRRADRERQRLGAAGDRLIDRIDRQIEVTVARAERLEQKIQKNIITALNLQYVPGVGMRSDPFKFGEGMVLGEISITSTDSFAFDPGAFEIGESKLELLDMQVMAWATVLAVRLSHSDQGHRMKVSWVKKQDRSSSPICIIDEQNAQYYYPVSADFTGEVMPGVPKIVLIAFEPFRVPTSRILVKISGARFTAQNFKPELMFRHESEALHADIEENIETPRLSDRVRESLEAEGVRARDEIAKKVKSSGGCLVLVAALIGVGALIVLG